MKEQSKIVVSGFYLLFFVSGVAALVYQSLWLRMFTLVLGNSLYSASIVFASFMFGLGLGAWLFGRYIEDRKDILGVYIVLELGIAVTGLATGKLIPHLSTITWAIQNRLLDFPFFLQLFRATISFLILLVPTVLIGGTLPVLTHFLTHRLDLAGRRIGGLYGWNTVGAVLGCAVTGFWLLKNEGMTASLYFAVGLNLLIVLAALVLRFIVLSSKDKVAGKTGKAAPGSTLPALSGGMQRLLLIAAGITGMAALAYEVVWARFLSFLLHNEFYNYYLMLSMVLLGIGVGSLVYARWLDRVKKRLRLLGLLEISLGPVVGICYLLCAFLYRQSGSAVTFVRFQDFFLNVFENPFYSLISIRLLYTVIAVFLPSAIMGIVFPLICRLYLTDQKNIASGTGRVYAANTAGAIVGALACGFLLVPVLGIQNSLFLIAFANLALGGAILLFDTRRNKSTQGREVAIIAAAAACFALMAFLPGNQVKEFALKNKKYTNLIYYREGLTGTVVVLEDKVDSTKTLYINSLGEVHNGLAGMQTFKVMGHLPLMLHESNPQDVLMVTFGGGIASGAVARHPIKVLDVVELEPAVVDASSWVFAEENRRVRDDPRIRIHLEDGRNYLSTSNKLYDVIISDSTNPASSDSWLLYTLEFYLLCLERLAPGGIMAQWLPVHSGSPESYCTIVKTFQTVFPHTSIWFTRDYTLLIGTPEPLSISYPELVEKLSVESIREDLEPYCLDNPLELLDCFLMGEASVRRMVVDATISTDNLPFYQLTTDEQSETRGILAMLEANRDRVFPFITDMEGAQAEALKDSLEVYYLSEAYILRRNFRAAAMVNPASCKAGRFFREDLERVSYIEKIAKYDPGNYSLQLKAAMNLVVHREYAKAREYFSILRNMRPDDPSNYSTLGNIDFILGDFPSSATNYRRALELDSKRVDLLGKLGKALASSGEFEEAVNVLTEALKHNSEDANALFDLGLCYNRMDKADSSATYYEKVLLLEPNYVDALINLGSIYLNLENTDRAERLFGRAAGLNPRSYSAWRGSGIALFRLGKHAESAQAFGKVLEIEPQDRLARQYLKSIADIE
jgi:spermidine synthase